MNSSVAAIGVALFVLVLFGFGIAMLVGVLATVNTLRTRPPSAPTPNRGLLVLGGVLVLVVGGLAFASGTGSTGGIGAVPMRVTLDVNVTTVIAGLLGFAGGRVMRGTRK